jgi:hypothetical protein
VDATVVVPLDVSDISSIKDLRDGVDDVLLDLRQSKVEHKLIASQSSCVLASVQHPVRVLEVERRVGVDHF